MSAKTLVLCGIAVAAMVAGLFYIMGGNTMPAWLRTALPYVAPGGAILLMMFAILSHRAAA